MVMFWLSPKGEAERSNQESGDHMLSILRVMPLLFWHGQGDPDAEFIFQAGTEIWIGAGVIFSLVKGAKWENVGLGRQL
jgi:hypothetical protein